MGCLPYQKSFARGCFPRAASTAGLYSQRGISLPYVRLQWLALTPYCVVMRPIIFPLNSTNQTSLVWAGPAVMPRGVQPNLF